MKRFSGWLFKSTGRKKILAFSLLTYSCSFVAYSGKVRLIRSLRDCKQRSSNVSKRAPTESKKKLPPCLLVECCPAPMLSLCDPDCLVRLQNFRIAGTKSIGEGLDRWPGDSQPEYRGDSRKSIRRKAPIFITFEAIRTNRLKPAIPSHNHNHNYLKNFLQMSHQSGT